MTVGRVGFMIITARVPIRFEIVRPFAVRVGAVVVWVHGWRRLGFTNGVDAAGHDDFIARIHGVADTAATDFYEGQDSLGPVFPDRFFGKAISGSQGFRIDKERGGFR